MAKPPAKAPEAVPTVGYTPLRLDGTIATGRDFMSGEPLMAGPPGYMLADRMVFPPAPERWLPDAMSTSAGLFPAQPPPAEWPACLADAMGHYFRDRLTELNAVDEREVLEALRAIRTTAVKLMAQLNHPPAKQAAYWAAWARIENARIPYEQGRKLKEELYPAMSLLTARLHAMERADARPAWRPDSISKLVQRLADHLATFGIMASGSNGIARKGGADNLSALARLVKIIIIGAGLSPPGAMTDSALNKAVLTALKSR